MKLHKIALAVFLGAASIAASAAENTTSQSPAASDTLSSADGTAKKHDSLEIVRPELGATITDTTTPKAVLRVGDGIRPKSLRVTLNGKNVSSHLQKEECNENACRWTVTLTKADRLLAGQNQLVASARGSHNNIELARTIFDYDYGLQAGQYQSKWKPSTMGLKLASGGAQPWVSVTTGTPASLQDNSDQTQYSLPYPDATFPTASDTACTQRYQVVALLRQNPAIEDAYFCAADAASLKELLTSFVALTKGTDIVMVSTTLGNNADSNLDTTSIGGTNYSFYPAAWQPMGYAAIGVSGAAPGSAYESYYLSSDLGHAYQTDPFANGLLAVDQNGNYNFHAGNNAQFEVYPNDPQYGTSSVFTAAGGSVTGWWPPAGSANGFWLLTLDRVTLLPIDFNQGSCNSESGNCGQFFATGSTDPNVAAQAALNLGQALGQSTYRQLIVLTTTGQPFQSASAATAGLISAVQSYGGADYTLPSLTTPTSTYTLVAPGLQGPTPSVTLTPFSRGVVNSSSAFSQQGQTGFVRGVMARDNNSLYFPSVVSQEDGKNNGVGATSVSINYDFYAISTQNSVDWPLTDTSGHIAAYHYASQEFLTRHYSKSGSHSQDLRYFYAGDPGIAQYNTDFYCPNPPNPDNPPSPYCPVYPGDGYGFTAQDLSDATAQLYSELTALNNTNNYLGEPGIGGVIQDNGGNAVADQVIQATYEVLNQGFGPVPSTSVSTSEPQWLNLLAAVASVAAAALGPADLPIVAAAVGVTSGLLWSGSAIAPGFLGDPVTPPSYESTFETTLGNVEENESAYASALAVSYGTALDNIYSDWGKLAATGAKTANSDSGWSFNNQLASTYLGSNISAGVRRATYIQLVPQFYSLDTYTQQPVSTVAKLGMFSSTEAIDFSEVTNICTASYPGALTSNGYAYKSYPSPGNPAGTNMFVMGGTINYQGTKNVQESLPSDSLLNVLFGSDSGDLNMPQDLVYGSNGLANRQGPSMGTYSGFSQCYKPGCVDYTYNTNQTQCINP